MGLLSKLFHRPAATPAAVAPTPPPAALGAGGELTSDLWVDWPDAHDRIDSRVAAGRLDAARAEKLRTFVDEGYLIFSLDLDETIFADVDRTIDRLWKEKPYHVAYAYHSLLKPFAFSDEAKERKPSYRIADLHSDCAEALSLYLNRQIFDWLELIFGRPAVATQSLYFEYGSQQPLHRDPVYVQMNPPSHLVAAWIALEDVGPSCGPLAYVPRSHRMPYFQFSPGEYKFNFFAHGEAETRAMAEFEMRQVAERGLAQKLFLCKRGDVLLWHASLLHGGSPSVDPTATRKSFVVHYSTLGDYKCLMQNVLERVPGEDGQVVERPRIFATERVLTRDGCAGFDNPLRDYRG